VVNGVIGTYSTASTAYVPLGTPLAPTSLAGTRGDQQVGLTWVAPTNTGGSAITDYVVQFSSNSGSTWSTFADGTSTTASATVTGLMNGTSYVFRVAAANANGTGTYTSATSALVPATTPGAPTSVVGTAGNTQVSLTWTTPASTGGSVITDYVVQFSSNGGSTWSTFADGTSTSTLATVTGLTNGTSYVFQIAAVNVAGTGSYSTESNAATPATTAGAPTSVSAVIGAASATVSWTAPASNGGAAITDYVIQFSANSGSWATFADGTSTSSSATVTGLTNGTNYTFRVAAVNSAGTGTYSTASSSVTPVTTPGAPTSAAASTGARQATISWTAPTSNGGSSITNYAIQFSTDAGSNFSTQILTGSTSTSYVYTGLTAGTAYVFRVAAITSVGQGGWSSNTSSLTIQDQAGAPTSVIGVDGVGRVVLSWTAPASNGGASISDYTIRFSANSGSSWSTFTDGVSAATSATVTGLTNGTSYIFQVAAVNTWGTGSYSASSSAQTPFTRPNAPAGVVGSPSSAQVVVTWSAAAANGRAVTDYVIQFSSNNGASWSTFADGMSATTSVTVNGLANGIAYVFRVAAVNSAGIGTYSTASTAVTPQSAPSLPLNVAGSGGNARVTLVWSAPSSNGGRSITDYSVRYSTNAGASWTIFSDGVSTATSATVTGLTNGTAYSFQVAALNSVGTGSYSVSSSEITPFSVPGQPTSISGTAGINQVSLSWSSPASDGGSVITDYVVEYSTNSGSTWATFVDAVEATTSSTVTGLTNGTGYIFRVTAKNTAGNGTASSTTSAIVPRTMPSAARSVAGTSGNAQVALTWSAPVTTGGAVVTDYEIQYSSNGTTWTTFSDSVSTTASVTVTGLTNGTAYTFRVAAVNGAGTGTYSTASSSVTPFTTPGTPTSVTPTRGNGQVSLSWTAPVSNGGSAIIQYRVQFAAEGSDDYSTWSSAVSTLSTSTSYVVTGLTNGTSYKFRVVATNAAGNGSYSSASSAVMPFTVSGAPTSIVTTNGVSQVVLSWTAPTSTGGDSITDYVIQHSSNSGSTWTTFSDSVSTSTSATVTGLTNGTSYVFRVAAVNAAGTGTYSSASASATPRTVSDAPSSVVATAGNGQVSLSWTVPASNGGSAVTDYSIEYSTDASAWTSFSDGTSTLRAATVTDLTNGVAYYFRVSAINLVGTSTASAPSSPVTPLTVPTAPTITQITTGNAMLNVAFSAAGDGGNPITTYQYSTDGGATWQTRTVGSTSSPLVISALSTNGTTALANGTTYSVQLRAVNSAGTGSASSSTTATPTTVPGAPTSVSSAPGVSAIDLEWTAPASNGGTAVSDYLIEMSTNGGSTWTTVSDGVSSTPSASVTGLTNGTQYIFRVSAVNSVGTGVASSWTTSVAPRTAPGTPSNLALVAGASSIAASWTAPSSGGSTITDYIIEYSTDGSTWATFSDGLSTSASTTISGLTNGTAYFVRVSAVNVAGTGTAVASGTTSTPRTTPNAPSISSIVADDSELSVRFSAGASGGSAITSYQYSVNGGSTWVTASGTSSPIVITGLTNGTRYQIALRAVNIVGSGAASNVLASTPRTTPGAPTISSVTAGANQATVVFTLSNNGGSPVTNYEYRVSTGSWTPWETATATASPLVISNLANGTTYNVEIRAVNAAGSGAASSTGSVTPFSSPGAPSITAVTGGVRSVTIAFNAGVTGGATITNYTYSLDDGATWTVLSTPSTTSPIVVSNLSDATQYSVKLAAINIAGTGSASSTVSVRTHGAPSQPTITSTNSRDGAVDVFFAGGANGGSPVTNYEYSTDGGSTWVARSSASTLSPLVIGGLTNGTTYSVAIRAVNSVGAGTASQASSIKPRTVPSAPTISSQPAVADQSLAIAFSAGADGGESITSYEYSTDRGATWLPRTDGGTTASPLTITKDSADGVTDLTNGITYDVQIRAVNVVGSGAASADISGTPATNPSAPSGLEVTSGNRYLLVSFTAGSNGGSAITNYEYSTDGGSTWRSALTTSTPITITVTSDTAATIANGTAYAVKIRAINAVPGVGAASSDTSATPSTNPGAPGNVVATYGSKSIAIEFEEGSNGGSDISGYEYSTDGGATWRMRDVGNTMTSSPITITKLSSDGLTEISNGSAYDVMIRAVNRAGAGRESSTVTVIPAGVPETPIITGISSSNGVLSVAFTAGNSGGRSVIRNEYSMDGGSTWVVDPTLNSPIVITGLTNGTSYALQVRQINEVGNGASSITVEGTPYTTPGAPTIDQISAGNGTISMFFTEGATNGNSVATYEYSTDDGVTWRTRRAGTVESPLSITMLSSDGTTPLQNGTFYSVKIRAVNAAGSGTQSESIRIAPYTVASAPVISSVATHNSFAMLTYSIASNGGATVSGYDYSLNGGISWLSASSTANPLRISGLTNGNSYSLILRAVNRAGFSDSSATVSLAPVGPPDAPRISTLTPSDGALEVEFTDGSTSGSPITGYEYSLDGGATWLSAGAATSSPFTITGLNNGTIYTVQVRALNGQGAGTSSDPVISKPYTVPGAPVITEVEMTGSEATVEYTTPSTDGGQSITSYEYSIDNGESWVSTNSSTVMSVQITNLVEGETYQVEVRAVNSAGPGTSAMVSTLSVVEEVPTPVVVGAPAIKAIPVVVPNITAPVVPVAPVNPKPVPAKTPASTVPPTTVKPVATPELLEESGGVQTEPGKAVTVIDGEIRDTTVTVEAGVGSINLDGGFSMTITPQTVDGVTADVSAGGVLQFARSGRIKFAGNGLQPNSVVDIWLNSNPVFLGTVTTDQNGAFEAEFDIPEGVLEGEHTLTIVGVSADGEQLTTSVGIAITKAEVIEPIADEDTSGSTGTNGLVLLGMLLIAGIGVALWLRQRKRTQAATQTHRAD
jgi:titin